MTPGDVLQAVGTIVAALIGIGGLWVTLRVEAESRYLSRLDAALGDVITSLTRRMQKWDDVAKDERRLRGTKGYPDWIPEDNSIDAEVQGAVEVARLAGKKPDDRECLYHLAVVTDVMLRVPVSWLLANGWVVAMEIRHWRLGEKSPREFVAWAEQYAKAAEEAAADFR